MTEALLTFTSHIAGKNAKVEIHTDRIEWERPRGISGGKVIAASFTLGMSALATGLKNGNSGTEMIPIRSISSVTTRRDGMLNTVVSVITTGNTIDFRVSHSEAKDVKALLQQLMLGAPQAAPTPVATAPAAAAADPTSQLQRLDSLRQQGILTQAEFDAKKAEILARL